MSDLVVTSPRVRLRGLTPTRFAHAVRNVAPRLAAALPGIICRHDPLGDDGRPRLYLTFDDGPDSAGTPQLLDALAVQQVRATFFLTAVRAARDMGLLRAVAGAGHSVANHGWLHDDPWRSAGAVANLERAEQWLQDALGSPIPDVRPPYGHVTPATYRWAREGGRRIVLWDNMPGDWLPDAHPAMLADELIKGSRAGSIVVLHDGRPAGVTAGALRAALPHLRDAGWRFGRL